MSKLEVSFNLLFFFLIIIFIYDNKKLSMKQSIVLL